MSDERPGYPVMGGLEVRYFAPGPIGKVLRDMSVFVAMIDTDLIDSIVVQRADFAASALGGVWLWDGMIVHGERADK